MVTAMNRKDRRRSKATSRAGAPGFILDKYEIGPGMPEDPRAALAQWRTRSRRSTPLVSSYQGARNFFS